jgi:hypothetical protein
MLERGHSLGTSLAVSRSALEGSWSRACFVPSVSKEASRRQNDSIVLQMRRRQNVSKKRLLGGGCQRARLANSPCSAFCRHARLAQWRARGRSLGACPEGASLRVNRAHARARRGRARRQGLRSVSSSKHHRIGHEHGERAQFTGTPKPPPLACSKNRLARRIGSPAGWGEVAAARWLAPGKGFTASEACWYAMC